MNVKLIILLSVLCAVLMAGIVGEWLYARHAYKQTLAALKVKDKKSAQLAKMPTINLTQKPELSFSDMVERPLFIKGRRPVPESVADPKQAVIKPTGPFNWQLNGIYTKQGRLHALFSRTVRVAKGNFRKLARGTDLDGWTLVDIQRDKAILNQPGSLPKTLLLRKPKPKTPKPNPVDPSQVDPNQANSNIAPPPNPNDPQMQGQQPPDPGVPQPNMDPNAVPPPSEIPPDGQVPVPGTDGAAPEGEPLPGSDEQMMPEDNTMPDPMADQEFQPDEFSQDEITTDDGSSQF
jgi:hypothetical protein